MLKNNRCKLNNAKQESRAMTVGNRTAKFHIDTHSSFDQNVPTTNTTLKTWNNKNFKPKTESRRVVKNPNNNKRYSVNFIVCHHHFKPIRRLRAGELLKLIKLESQNLKQNAIEESRIFTAQGKCENKYNGKLQSFSLVFRFTCASVFLQFRTGFSLCTCIVAHLHCNKELTAIQLYGYKKYGTHARVFSQTLAHVNSNNEMKETDTGGKKRVVSMKKVKRA